LEGDHPKPENFPLSGDIVGKPKEFLIVGSIGDGDRKRGIAFMGETTAGGVEAGLGVVFLLRPKKEVFSLVGDGRGGGPIKDVDRFLFWSLRNVGDKAGVVEREGGNGDVEVD
jgi:hypothetical protein